MNVIGIVYLITRDIQKAVSGVIIKEFYSPNPTYSRRVIAVTNHIRILVPLPSAQ